MELNNAHCNVYPLISGNEDENKGNHKYFITPNGQVIHFMSNQTLYVLCIARPENYWV